MRGYGEHFKRNKTFPSLIIIASVYVVLNHAFSDNLSINKEIAVESHVPIVNATSVCKRYAYVSVSAAGGLGHKFGETILGMVFAFENDAEFVVDARAYLAKGTHGAYPWMIEFWKSFDFPTVEEAKKSTVGLRVEHVVYWEHSAMYSNDCNIMLRTDYRRCSFMDDAVHAQDKATCFRARIGAYNSVKVMLRRRFNRFEFCSEYPHLLSGGEQTLIVWHLRSGDLVLHENDAAYFITVWEQIKASLPPDYRLIFLGEPGSSSQFNFLENLMKSASVVDNLDVKESLCLMLNSDLLITSGSSFPNVVGALSDPVRGPVILQAQQKEGNFYGIYEVFDQGYILANGTILPPPAGYLLRNRRSTSDLAIKLQDHMDSKSMSEQNGL